MTEIGGVGHAAAAHTYVHGETADRAATKLARQGVQPCSRETNRNIVRAVGVVLDNSGTQGNRAIGQTRGCGLELVSARGEGSTRLVARLQQQTQLDTTFGAEVQAAVCSDGGWSLAAAVLERQQVAATRVDTTHDLKIEIKRETQWRANEIQNKTKKQARWRLQRGSGGGRSAEQGQSAWRDGRGNAA